MKKKLYMVCIGSYMDIVTACYVIATSKSKALSRAVRDAASVMGGEKWAMLKEHKVRVEEIEEFLPPGNEW